MRSIAASANWSGCPEPARFDMTSPLAPQGQGSAGKPGGGETSRQQGATPARADLESNLIDAAAVDEQGADIHRKSKQVGKRPGVAQQVAAVAEQAST